ncbi:adenosine transporter, putative [Trypanosoma brucei gambiense DAL972]|uniref:Adenosine transporter, putative n=1 Tax=Trypanosoma brucei gambiense (strain MHOM/CI/86/DAL972) TaxID=679716 RepID=C9ZKT6_TRYB9|nr:adenosine transporter, putative [Trypanosoma brucei gambiense DAL972]CBH09679.1 adenosine transporter, putative [Trypanosoma brucei gambiense DAL972]|eukprot:XP_011771972.1 adenosine transporter, putative [Trypanosoma brucei gambiense DAL972]
MMLGFESVSEFTVYITFIFFGMSAVVVTTSIFSIPFFFIEYYKYAQGDPNAEAEDQRFWNNVFTYYNATTFLVEFLLTLFMLTNLGRRIPLAVRLGAGLILSILAVFVVIMVTIIKTTETGAKVTIMLVGVINGVAATLCDTGNGALISPFPTKFFSAAVWGVAVCGVITSFFSIVIKASMESNYESMLTQSRIFFGLVVLLEVVSCILLVLLRKNPYAMKYAAEFRYAAKERTNDCENKESGTSNGPAEQDEDPVAIDNNTTKGNVMTVTVDPDTMKDTDQVENITNSQQMLKAKVSVVLKRVWPMLAAGFLAFSTTFLVYPGVFFAVKTDVPNGWYMTITAAMFHFGDFLSRLLLQFKRLQPSPRYVVVGTFARVFLIIPLVFCVRGIIGGTLLPYILSFLWGLTYGYFGGMALIHTPRTGSLTAAGERSLAANCAVIAILCGLFSGSMLALAVKEGLPQ